MHPNLGKSVPVLHKLYSFAIVAFLLLQNLLILSPTSAEAAAPTELFFSEYIEGSSNNKALEIYNGTGADINLSTYVVQMYFNGASTNPTTINLTGTVAGNGTFVLAPTNANATILAVANQQFGTAWFNGDDAVVLRKGGAAGPIIDVIGQIGFDPGTEWGTGLVSTADNTIRRKSAVSTGDTNATNVFDPSAEWNGFATDTFDGLGSHTFTDTGTPTPTPATPTPTPTTPTPTPSVTPTPTPTVTPTPTPTPGTPDSVVISQVYGGGGNSGAQYKNDFIEIFNRSGSAVDLTGWSVQYASSGGTTWSRTSLSGSIAPGQYYLIQQAAGTGGSVDLPNPDAIGTLALGGSDGKVALVSNNTSLTGGCPTSNANVVDFVGYGSANCFEGTGATPSLSSTAAAIRNNDGCEDTGNNSADFTALTPAPRNSASPTKNCIVGEAAPSVSTTNPSNGATNVSLTSNITINFNEPVTVFGNWFQVSCSMSGVHTGTVSGGSRSFSINPDIDFVGNELCTVTVFGSQVSDLDAQDPPDNMAADYSFSFRTVSVRSSAEHLVMGNPSNAAADVNTPNNYLLAKPQFVASYNRDRLIPNWTSWHLDSSWLGGTNRTDDFAPDNSLPQGWYRVGDGDYSGSGFNRGHMTPSGDRTSSVPDNQATFLMTNMIPQSDDNNQGPWEKLESYSRSQVGGGNELYIISGGHGDGGVGDNGPRTTIGPGIAVPALTWKVIVVLPVGDNDVSRVTTQTRTIAVIMPNGQGIRNDSWQKYLVSVDQVEALTGYDFFSNVPEEIQSVIEAKPDPSNNNAPIANNQSVTTAEDSQKSITLTASDANVGNALTYTVETEPSHGTLSGSGADLTYLPSADYNGVDSFVFRVSDGTSSSTATVSINVTAVNDAPVLSAIGNKTIDEDTTLTFTAQATDVDTAANILVYSLVNPPAGALINPVTGEFNWNAAEPGVYHFGIKVADSGNPALSDEETITVTVKDVTAPVISNAPANQTLEASSADGTVANWNEPTANDNVDGTVAVECTRASGSTFALGSTMVSCTASDQAGNVSSHSFRITVRDTIEPVLNLPGNISVNTGTNNAAVNWNASAVDTVSGNVAVVCNPLSGSTFALGQTTVNCSATDGAGNTANGSFVVAVIDAKAPTVAIESPIGGATYTIGQSVAAVYNCSDAGSGINSCTGTVASGALIDTSSVGMKTFAVTAFDNAGNRTTETISYSVGFGILALFDQTKANNSGSAIQIQLQIVGASGNNLSAANVKIQAVRVDPGALPVESPGSSNPENMFAFDSASQSYKYNLKSEKTWAPGTYRLVFNVAGDPAEHFVEFIIK
jgi:DNA/RNA endonuclease G (NUC1)